MGLMEGFSAAEVELLVLLTEECAEVQAIIQKAFRHGRHSYHPDDIGNPKVTNAELLAREVGDVLASLSLCLHYGLFEAVELNEWRDDKLKRVDKWLHEAEVPSKLAPGAEIRVGAVLEGGVM